ncbi:MAG: hypothetical protein U1D55_18220 [Phycisphaerae bacterium]
MSFSDLPHQVRESTSDWRERLRAWRAEVREDPTLLWRTPLIRAGGWAILGLVSCVIVGRAVSVLSAEFREDSGRARTATLYVACTNPACLYSTTIVQPINFSQWPIKCEKCGGLTVRRAGLCEKCRHWFALLPENPPGCPYCAAQAARDKKPEKPKKKTNPDDEEDGW